MPQKGTTHFFLELDRGSEELKRFRDKVEAYVAYYKSGMYAQRYGAQGFRVLTVVDGVGEGRLKNLVDDTARVAGIGRRFWFTHLADATGATVLTEPIWSVAGSDEKEAIGLADTSVKRGVRPSHPVHFSASQSQKWKERGIYLWEGQMGIASRCSHGRDTPHAPCLRACTEMPIRNPSILKGN